MHLSTTSSGKMWPTPRVAAADLSTAYCADGYYEVELLDFILLA